MRWIIDKIYLVAVAALLDLGIVLGSGTIYLEYFSKDAINEKVYSIYKELLIQTGQTQDALPLEIIDQPVDNAYNNGQKIVIYTGLINHTDSWDEVALVLGHEIAHGMLGHLKLPLDELSDMDIQVLEANADKMGAIYIEKAGYDVCKGRQLYKYFLIKYGNALGENHPDFSYRYEELNINCEDN